MRVETSTTGRAVPTPVAEAQSCARRQMLETSFPDLRREVSPEDGDPAKKLRVAPLKTRPKAFGSPLGRC